MNNPTERLWHSCYNSSYIRWQLTFARSTLAAENIALLLLDEEGENLIFAASVGANAEKYTGGGDFEKALRVPMSGGIGMNPLAVMYSKPMSMEQPDPRHNPTIDRAVGTSTRSLYTVPVAGTERTLGTLSVINVHLDNTGGTADRFAPEDLEAHHAAAEAINLWITKEWERLASDSQSLFAD